VSVPNSRIVRSSPTVAGRPYREMKELTEMPSLHGFGEIRPVKVEGLSETSRRRRTVRASRTMHGVKWDSVKLLDRVDAN
jgi:hypothetical protein